MARSLAFWFDEKTGATLPELELHINFWSLNSEDTNFLDIGVRLKNKGSEKTFENINIYIPFDVNQDNYLPQLGLIVCSDPELISAIFNSTVTTTTANAKDDIFEITFSPTNKLNFYTQILPEENNSGDGVKLSTFKEYGDDHKGTILTFPNKLIDCKTNTDDSYFRFRIKLDKANKNILGPEYSPKDSWITNHFESIEMVDFRINEPRNLPAKIRSNLTNNLGLKDVHFFLIRDANAEFKISHSKYKRCRILENNIWKKYLKLGSKKTNLPEQMLIYHWAESKGKEESKKDQVIEHFSAFAKFTKRKVGLGKMLIVLAIVLAIGVGSGLFANYLWTFIGPSVKSDISCVDRCDLLNKTKYNKEKAKPKKDESKSESDI